MFALAMLWSAAAWAQGGPPMMTDDPGTPGHMRWEINFATLIESSPGERRVETPRVDLNYGVGPRIQLKFEIPVVRLRAEDRGLTTGIGDALVGVKWRFLGGEGTRLAWSIYPQFEFNMTEASIAKGIIEKGHALVMPTEVTLDLGRVQLNGEVGRVFSSNRTDTWMFGFAAGTHVLDRLELLGEVHGEQVPDGPTDLFLTIGTRPQITETLTLLFAGGRTLRAPSGGGSQHYYYLGLQVNLPRERALASSEPPKSRQ
jgi:hypothetical protein